MAAVDKFPANADPVWGPARNIFSVSVSAGPIVDQNGNEVILKSLRCAGAGTVTIKTVDNQAGVVHPVLDGERIDGRITHVTTVSGVTGMIGAA